MKIRQSTILMLLIFAVLLPSACGGGGSSDGNSGGGNSSGGNSGSGGTAPPGAPTGLTVTSGNAQVALSWTAVSGASGYTVYYSQASIASLTASGVTKVENISSAAHTVTALTNGRRYFVVTATNAGGESAASGEVSVTPQASMASISGSAGRYGEPRVAAPFAILSFTWDAVQKFVAADPDVNVPALEYRWSIRNRSATASDLADGAIRSSFYQGGPRPC